MREEIYSLINQITPADSKAILAARRKWDSIAKPLGSLGAFEDIIAEMAGLMSTAEVSVKKPVLAVLCADNGVVEEGVSQSGQEVTLSVMRALAERKSTVSFMAEETGCEVIPVDVGVCLEDESNISCEIKDIEELCNWTDKDSNDNKRLRILDRRIRNGTGNIAKEPAMTMEECIKAVQNGISIVRDLKNKGFDLILTGEMGIGNTTTSAAVASVLTGKDPSFFVGRGAGLPDEKLKRKLEIVKRAIAFHNPDPEDIIGVLSAVGGFDIAGLCGMFLGGAIEKVPVVIDGYISSVAALCAYRLNPLSKKAMIASHLTAEQGGRLIIEELGKKAVIQADMHLGEGGGAMMMLPMLKMALAVYNSGHVFDQLGIEAYQRFEHA
ncbi:MAG: nicotinate-nucleotide--dimethylbenzimidazole phosphoribosyltransferase [Lachnospiraceae bacterium]|nr:nicotinate-nucleotide--dimethylbenzimidazole phosphoribosyltransferase [Lachnospiraceae bacterium]